MLPVGWAGCGTVDDLCGARLLFVTLRGPAWGQRGEHSSRYGWRRSPTYRRGERRGCPQVGRSLLQGAFQCNRSSAFWGCCRSGSHTRGSVSTLGFIRSWPGDAYWVDRGLKIRPDPARPLLWSLSCSLAGRERQGRRKDGVLVAPHSPGPGHQSWGGWTGGPGYSWVNADGGWTGLGDLVPEYGQRAVGFCLGAQEDEKGATIVTHKPGSCHTARSSDPATDTPWQTPTGIKLMPFPLLFHGSLGDPQLRVGP